MVLPCTTQDLSLVLQAAKALVKSTLHSLLYRACEGSCLILNVQLNINTMQYLYRHIHTSCSISQSRCVESTFLICVNTNGKKKKKKGTPGRNREGKIAFFLSQVPISAFHNSAELRKHCVIRFPKRKEGALLPNPIYKFGCDL